MRLLSNSINIRGAVLVVVVCFLGTAAFGQPWDGNGVEGDPYLIYDACDMQAIGADANYWDAHFVLCADVNLASYTGTSFNIIGNESNPFTGIFDGNGHTISNFTYTSTGTDNIGLFRYVDDPNAEIKDLRLIDPDVDARSYVGSLVGHNEEATITNCYVDGGSVSGDDRVGGLVGYNWVVTIADCYSTASVSGRGRVGGLVGNNYNSTISNCYSTGTISATTAVGGLVGRNETVGWVARITNCYSTGSVTGTGRDVGGLLGYSRRAEIYNCYSTASVSGEEYVGGLVGYKESGLISNCYSTGSVSGDDNVGGLVGRSGNGGVVIHCYSVGSVTGTGSDVGGLVGTGGTVFDSFWDIQTSGQTTSAGGTGLVTAQMKDANTYLYWGCGLVWTIDDGVDYPHLIWEGVPGEIISAQLSDFVGGSGTETDPYLIYTAEELNLIGLFWCEFDKYFKLMADIDLSAYTGTSFNIIGHKLNPFTGVFDGNGNTISNFTYDVSGLSYPYHLYLGLFGSAVGPSAEIKDLGLIDPNVNGGNWNPVGALVGFMNKTDITNCYVDGGSVSGSSGAGSTVGGLVGRNETVDGEARITNCYSTAIVSGEHYVGGLVGYTRGGEIFNCYSTGTVSATGYDVGGLVGKDYRGTVSNSYATGSVSGTQRVGGLVGYGRSGEISNCYSTGTVSATGHDVGGLVGMSKTIINCYSTASVSGSTLVGGLVGGNFGIITNSYSSGSVSGDGYVGGLVGENWGTMTNCYSTASVSGATVIGGLVGENYILITNSFWDTQTSGRTNMCGSSQFGASGCDDDNGKTTAQMQMESTFISAGWDFVGEVINGPNDIWDICEGTNYPKLAWQILLGDFICPDGVDWSDLEVLCEDWLLEEFSADVGPDGGDGFVNFLDWAIFADGWQTTIDFDDLAEFADQWLKTGSNYLIADIAPGSGGDGIVNMRDFAALANNWLAGL